MRAHFLPDLKEEQNYILSGEAFHHLVNVVRIKSAEELLLLDGKGLVVETLVESVSKKSIVLKFQSANHYEREYFFDIVIAMPKKEALELCLKEATELGFRKIFLIRSDYSQMRFPETERALKLLSSALEQSNAPFLPEIINTEWEKISWSDYHEVLLLDSQSNVRSLPQANKSVAPRLLIIGPEGGFSPREQQLLHLLEQVKIVNLPTPILRTPTALAAGAGIMLERLLK